MAEVLTSYLDRPQGFDPLEGHPDKERLILDSAKQASLLAGREKPFAWEIDNYLSEAALHRYRAIADIEALIHLAECGPFEIEITEEDKRKLKSIFAADAFDAEEVVRIDHIGRRIGGKKVKPLEHDVKSVEVYVGEKMDELGLGYLIPWLHFAATSEDTNNLAYNLMLRDVTNEVFVPAVARVADRLAHIAAKHAETPLVGVTHAQDASPQTVGKRFGKMLYGLTEVMQELENLELSGKFGGAVGNHNALVTVEPDFDWDAYSKEFVESFGFKYSAVEDQRNNHLAVTAVLENYARTALVVHQAIQNMWLNIRDNILVQELVDGEKGSSTMAHKINPWRLENSEALLEQAQKLIEGAKPGLVESRDERDLSDHDWQRAYGDMIGRVVAALNYTTVQFDRLYVNEAKAEATLTDKGEVLSELLQTAGRLTGDVDAYNAAVKATQGRKLTTEEIHQFIMEAIPEGELRDRALILPERYYGNAPAKAREAVIGWHGVKFNILKGTLDWRKALDAILFDLDDTLVMGDKVELHARVSAIKDLLDADISEDELVKILQTEGYAAMIDAFLSAHNDKHPDQLIDKSQYIETNKRISGDFDHLLELADGAHELLDELDRYHVKKAIVSARGPASLPRVLETHQFTARFDAVVHGQETNSKPHPAPIGLALKKLGNIAGNRAMMIGDHPEKDIIPANAHGLKTVLVGPAEVREYGAQPTMRVVDLSELTRKFSR